MTDAVERLEYIEIQPLV